MAAGNYGNYGQILSTIDGGLNWSLDTVISTSSMNAIWIENASQVLLGSHDGSVVKRVCE